METWSKFYIFLSWIEEKAGNGNQNGLYALLVGLQYLPGETHVIVFYAGTMVLDINQSRAPCS
jgi:hypothetical protein